MLLHLLTGEGLPHPVLEGGTPSSPGWWDTQGNPPPVLTWTGVTPSQVWTGIPPAPPLPGWGTSSPSRGVDWHTKWKYYLSLSFKCGQYQIVAPEWGCNPFWTKFIIFNKKILLREGKRHTARRVASACYADLSRGVPYLRSRGVPRPMSGGVPHPGSGVGVLHPRSGGGYPIPGPARGEGGTPSQTWPGYPPGQTWDGVPPRIDLGWGTPYPDLRWGTPSPHRGVDWHTKLKYYLPPSFGCGR